MLAFAVTKRTEHVNKYSQIGYESSILLRLALTTRYTIIFYSSTFTASPLRTLIVKRKTMMFTYIYLITSKIRNRHSFKLFIVTIYLCTPHSLMINSMSDGSNQIFTYFIYRAVLLKNLRTLFIYESIERSKADCARQTCVVGRE